jgi:hypothetical protein
MPFIKLSNGESVNVNEVARYKKTTREIPQERIEPFGASTGLQRVTRLPPTQETVLHLTFKDGKNKTLYGAEADAAHRVLEMS